MNTQKTWGFTLIELMVVITIITILSAIGLAAFAGARANARDASRIADLEQMSLALEVHRQANGEYPASLSSLVPDLLEEMPLDPRTGDSYNYDTSISCDGTNRTILYADLEGDSKATEKCGFSLADQKYVVIVGPAR